MGPVICHGLSNRALWHKGLRRSHPVMSEELGRRVMIMFGDTYLLTGDANDDE